MSPKNDQNSNPKDSSLNNSNSQSSHSSNQDQYAPQTPDTNRPDLGEPTANPTTSHLSSK